MPEYYKTDKGYYYKKTKRGANRISIKEYNNAMKNKRKIKQKGGMYDEISKEELIKHIYEHLLKNNVIQRLKNESILFHQKNSIANVQSIMPYYFYSYLFSLDNNIKPIYIPDDDVNYLNKRYGYNMQSNIPYGLKNYFEITVYINYDIWDGIIYLSDGFEQFHIKNMNDSQFNVNILYNLLTNEINKNIKRIWQIISGFIVNQKNVIILPVNMIYSGGGGHQCVIIFDNINNIIYPFDPNDNSETSIIYQIANTILENLYNRGILNKYKIVESSEICDSSFNNSIAQNDEYWQYKCPVSGFNCTGGRGYCVQITFFYISFIVNNLNYKYDKLMNEFIQVLTLKDNNIRDMKDDEYNNFINDIDIPSNIRHIINVYHLYLYYKIKEWIDENNYNININTIPE